MNTAVVGKKTDKDRLDELIDWYNQNKPLPGRVIKVRFATKDLLKFATKILDTNQWSYRNVVLDQMVEQL